MYMEPNRKLTKNNSKTDRRVKSDASNRLWRVHAGRARIKSSPEDNLGDHVQVRGTKVSQHAFRGVHRSGGASFMRLMSQRETKIFVRNLPRIYKVSK